MKFLNQIFSSSKKVIFTLAFLASITQANAQCFEIESILVDACGSPEGENEMLRFKTGSTALNSSDISITWASANPWLGICQNTASANATSSLNNTITNGCGILIEPPGGVLPTNKSILLLTSTDIDASANSFANLNDTLYVIYQCSGNTGGHFGNYGSGFRSITMNFSSPTGCSDIATYDKSLLLNQNLQSGGNSALKNGALVNFDPAGNDTYDNLGCQAAFTPIDVSANNLSNLSICPGDSINLTSTLTGGIQAVIWTGNSGYFSNSTTATTTYFSSINDITPYYLYLGGISSCNDTIYDSLLVNINDPNVVTISEPDTVNLCTGDSITFHATSSNPVMWNTGATTDSITTNTAGTYFVSASGNCPSNIDTVIVIVSAETIVNITEPNLIDICEGSDITLHANGSSSYIWNDGSTLDSLVTSSSGTYFVTSNENCPSNTDTTQITITVPPTISILESDSINICQQETLILHKNGTDPFIWNTGEISDSISITTAGVYYISSSNNCFTTSDTTIVNIVPQLTINIVERDTTICDGETLTVNAIGGNSYIWSSGETTNSIIISNNGVYSVTSNEICPSDTAKIEVTISPQVSVSILEGDSTTICDSTTTTLKATGATNYTWSTGATTDTISINTVGEYFVETKNGNCPSGYDTINVLNSALPSVKIIGDSLICTDESLLLTASGDGNFYWSNGDFGETTNILTEGQIILTATNNCNLSVSDTLNIKEHDCSTTIFIPNSFTPNNDNLNNTFKAYGNNIDTFNGKIYNRWGELVFEWNDINIGWDGTYKNKELPQGIYIYSIQIKYINDVNDNILGRVSLLR